MGWSVRALNGWGVEIAERVNHAVVICDHMKDGIPRAVPCFTNRIETDTLNAG